jgi:hypothetical protein
MKREAEERDSFPVSLLFFSEVHLVLSMSLARHLLITVRPATGDRKRIE